MTEQEVIQKENMPAGARLTERVITVDGLSGSGKTAIGKGLSQKFRTVFFSSGLMYRSIGVWALNNKISLKAEDGLYSSLIQAKMRLVVTNNLDVEFQLEDRTVNDLAGPTASEAASLVAQYPKVRSLLLTLQHELVVECEKLIGKSSPIVLVAEGRDMGTVIYPHALVKFFLKADASSRLKMRQEQLGGTLSEEQQGKEITHRDARDSGRSVAPTKPALDALVVVNKFNGVEQVVLELVGLCKTRIEETKTA
jgi:CMP/dCMP kinase